MLKGKYTGTADDKIVIVGAHYDTTSRTRGVDDNGSGVTALLQVAKQIGKECIARSIYSTYDTFNEENCVIFGNVLNQSHVRKILNFKIPLSCQKVYHARNFILK